MKMLTFRVQHAAHFDIDWASALELDVDIADNLLAEVRNFLEKANKK